LTGFDLIIGFDPCPYLESNEISWDLMEFNETQRGLLWTLMGCNGDGYTEQ